MNKRRMGILLALALLVSIVFAGIPQTSLTISDIIIPAASADGNDRVDAKGLETSKTVRENNWSDSTTISDYTIDIEAYATGKSVITGNGKPCDIIMVLDTSSSMLTDMEEVLYSDVTISGTYYYADTKSGKTDYYALKYCPTCNAFVKASLGDHTNHSGAVKYKPAGSTEYTGAGTATQFYKATEKSRLEMLKKSGKAFVEIINKACSETIDHRIGIISFNKNVTENIALTYVNTESGKNAVENAFDTLVPDKETATGAGLKKAYNWIDSQTDDIKNEYVSGKRNLVVILFSDGQPNYYDGNKYANDTTSYIAANGAVLEAYYIKNMTYQPTLYTIGCFEGANASQSAVNSSDTVANNNILKVISSNYPDATNIYTGSNKTLDTTNIGSVQSGLSGGGYYLTVGDEEALLAAFNSIATQATGGSDIALDETTYVKDVLTEQFVLPEGYSESDIKVYTVDCTGADANGNLTFGTTKTDFNATIETGTDAVTGRTYVNVTNFDYGENWCGAVTQDGTTKYRGKKLIIEIPVNVRNGFVGGNNVATNESTSAVYKPSATAGESDTLIEELDEPQVNVPVMDITVVTPDRNVYLYGKLTYEQLLDGASGTDDDVTVTLSRERYKYDFTNKKQVAYTDSVAFDIDDQANNYDLFEWQTAYVDITGDTAESFTDLTEDTTYTVDCTIAPSAAAETGSVGTEAASKIGSSTGDVNVFKPVMTFKDTSVKYGKTASENTDAAVSTWDAYYEKYNYVSTEWKHGDTVSTAVTMIGGMPTLTRTYTADSANFDSGKVNTKDDIAVNVTVELGTINKIDITKLNFVTFEHEYCNVYGDGCAFDKNTEEFLLHVSGTVGKLTITKSGLTVSTESKESAVFEVTSVSDSTKTWTVVINGNGSVTLSELPAGEYTIKEKDAWTWRYSSLDEQTVTVPAGGEGTAEFTNKRSTDKWLGGDNYADNVFGKATGGN